MTATAYPLTWPDNMPRSKNQQRSQFRTSLGGALKNVKGSIAAFSRDSGKSGWTGEEPEGNTHAHPAGYGYTSACCPSCGHDFNEHEISRYSALEAAARGKG